jgi:DNA-directed RNA polymerase specialized sigma subunit
MLERYNSNVAMYKMHELEIQSLQKKLEYANKIYIEAYTENVLGESLKSKNISDMPLNCNNQFRSTTETVALFQKRVYNNQFDIESIKTRLNKLMAEIEPQAHEIDIIDSLICCLGEKEKFVIENNYKNKLNLVDVAKRFSAEYDFVSYITMSRMRDKALDRMAKISNRVI